MDDFITIGNVVSEYAIAYYRSTGGMPAELFVRLHDRIRPYGVHVVGSRGSGKSYLLGRRLAWEDFKRGIPTIIIDNRWC